MKRIHHHHRCHSVALRAAHRGMTLLEIMIVIAILGLVMGLVIVPKLVTRSIHSQEQITRLAVKQLATSYGPQWQVASGKQCPESLLVIAEFVGKGKRDIIDPWDTPYELFCGKDSMPPGAHDAGFAVLSYGPDKKKDTEDDIRSWDAR